MNKGDLRALALSPSLTISNAMSLEKVLLLACARVWPASGGAVKSIEVVVRL